MYKLGRHGKQIDELLDLVEELHGFLRYDTFDAARGEGEVYRKGLDVLARYGRVPKTSSTSCGNSF
jgi:hypothetical protein